LARGCAERDDLCVRTAKPLMPAIGDNLLVNGDDAANKWVGLDETLTAHGQTKSMLHVTLVNFGKHLSDPARKLKLSRVAIAFQGCT
jgi:hypothetical protein